MSALQNAIRQLLEANGVQDVSTIDMLHRQGVSWTEPTPSTAVKWPEAAVRDNALATWGVCVKTRAGNDLRIGDFVALSADKAAELAAGHVAGWNEQTRANHKLPPSGPLELIVRRTRTIEKRFTAETKTTVTPR